MFQSAAAFAALHLKVSKCFLTPLAGPFTPALAQKYRDWIARAIPAWAEFQIPPSLKYLGLILGPEVRWQSWIAPRAKHSMRVQAIAAASPSTAVAAAMYDKRALTTLSYV
eukprot:7741514-Pyramimonas_sp.AAC.1